MNVYLDRRKASVSTISAGEQGWQYKHILNLIIKQMFQVKTASYVHFLPNIFTNITQRIRRCKIVRFGL